MSTGPQKSRDQTFAHTTEYWAVVNIDYLHTPIAASACEEGLWGILGVGQEKEGALATMSMELEFCLQFPCGTPSTEL